MRYIWIFLFIIHGITVNADEFKFHHYTTTDGLSHNEIRVIEQSPDGKLWLGTQNGLSSFDGYRFKVFKHDTQDSSSLSGDKIDVLMAETNGRLWIGTNNGLSVFNTVTEKSVRWEARPGVPYGVRLISKDSKGNIWLFSGQGNYRLSSGNLNGKEVFPGERINSFAEDESGHYWVGQNNELSNYDESLTLINQYDLPEIGNVLFVKHELLGNKYVVGTTGIYKITGNRASKLASSRELLPSDYSIRTCCAYQNDYLVMGSYGGGMVTYNLRSGSIRHYLHDPMVIDNISSNDVYEVFSTSDGMLWAGTQEGVDVYDPLRHRFQSIIHNPADANTIGHHFVQAITQDTEGYYWIGTRDKGLDRLEITTDEPIEYRVQHFKSISNHPDSLWGDYVWCVMEDSKNRIWVGTWGGGLNLYDRTSNRFRHFNFDPYNKRSLPSDAVTSLLEDRYGNIWVGTLGGLALLMEKGDEWWFRVFKNDQYDPRSICLNTIFSLLEDSKGRIWIGINNGGVNLMHFSKGEEIWFERFRHQKNDSTSLSNDEVFALFEDYNKDLWVGTSGGGFNRIIETKGSDGKSKFAFKAYTEAEGLPDNEVNGILQDEKGWLWVSTNKGLTRFDPETEKMVNYDVYDGLLKGKFRKNTALKDQKGYMWFGGTAGINRFHPDAFPVGGDIANPKIASLLVDEKRITEGNESGSRAKYNRESNTLTLTWPQNRFKARLFSDLLSGVRRIKYKYCLDERIWKEVSGDDPTIYYNQLFPGRYNLYVKTENVDGSESEPIELLTVHVKLPFWVYLFPCFILLFILGRLMKKKFTQRLAKSKKVETNEPEGITQIGETELGLKLKQLMEYQQLYLNPQLTAADLAKAANITYAELTRELKENHQQNYTDFINHYRVEEVKTQLVDPENRDKPILTVAWECGFNSKSAFNRIFKLMTGVTPSEYRKKNVR